MDLVLGLLYLFHITLIAIAIYAIFGPKITGVKRDSIYVHTLPSVIGFVLYPYLSGRYLLAMIIFVIGYNFLFFYAELEKYRKKKGSNN